MCCMGSETSGACMHALTASNAKLLKQSMRGEGCQELDPLTRYDTVAFVCVSMANRQFVQNNAHRLLCTRPHMS